MNVNLLPVFTPARPEYDIPGSTDSAKVFVDGELIGEAVDCDLGRWVLVVTGDEDHPLNGCFPANSMPALAYAITQCVEDVTVAIDGKEVEA